MFYRSYLVKQEGDQWVAAQVITGTYDAVKFFDRKSTDLTITDPTVEGLRAKLKDKPYFVQRCRMKDLPDGVLEEWY